MTCQHSSPTFYHSYKAINNVRTIYISPRYRGFIKIILHSYPSLFLRLGRGMGNQKPRPRQTPLLPKKKTLQELFLILSSLSLIYTCIQVVFVIVKGSRHSCKSDCSKPKKVHLSPVRSTRMGHSPTIISSSLLFISTSRATLDVKLFSGLAFPKNECLVIPCIKRPPSPPDSFPISGSRSEMEEDLWDYLP
jgi:hypothetical protein